MPSFASPVTKALGDVSQNERSKRCPALAVTIWYRPSKLPTDPSSHP